MWDRRADSDASAKPGISLWRRLRAWTMLALLIAGVAAMTWSGLRFSWDVVRPGVSFVDRMNALLYAGALLVLPGTIARNYLRRWMRSGRWRPSRDEWTQQRAQCAVRRRTNSPSPPWSWVVQLYRWANYSAGDSSVSLGRRALAWVVLILYGAGVLAVAAFALICVGAAFADDNSMGQSAGFLAIGALLIVFPILVVRSLWRQRRETGSFRVSYSEVAAVAEARREWEERERRRPLGAKITGLAVMALALGVLWVRGLHAPHVDWLSPMMWTAFAAYVVWVQFGRPRTDRSG